MFPLAIPCIAHLGLVLLVLVLLFLVGLLLALACRGSRVEATRHTTPSSCSESLCPHAKPQIYCRSWMSCCLPSQSLCTTMSARHDMASPTRTCCCGPSVLVAVLVARITFVLVLVFAGSLVTPFAVSTCGRRRTPVACRRAGPGPRAGKVSPRHLGYSTQLWVKHRETWRVRFDDRYTCLYRSGVHVTFAADWSQARLVRPCGGHAHLLLRGGDHVDICMPQQHQQMDFANCFGP